MQITQLPTKISVPFADGGAKNVIPNTSQIGVTPGAASFIDGFPPATRTPIESGGTPPDGLDFNGIFNIITAWSRWQAAGAPIFFDAAFSAAIGGYPKGVELSDPNAPGKFWVSTIDNNTHNPDLGDVTGWLHVVGATFSPVQQGGGVGQSPNKVYMGYRTDGNVSVTIDATDLGALAFQSYVNQYYQPRGDYATNATVATKQPSGDYISRSEFSYVNGVQVLPTGYIIQTFGVSLGSGQAAYLNYPYRFPSSCFAVVGTIGAAGDPQAALQVAPVADNPGVCLARLTGSGGGSNGINLVAFGK